MHTRGTGSVAYCREGTQVIFKVVNLGETREELSAGADH